MSMRKTSRIRIIALALFVVGVGCLFFMKMSQSFVSQMTVAEALEKMPAPQSRVRLSGVVGPSGLTASGPGRQVMIFTLLDKDSPDVAVTVNCQGLIPDGVFPGTEVFAEGAFTGPTHAFLADTLIVRCASHYR